MKRSKFIMMAGCIMALSALSLSSCSSSDTVEDTSAVVKENTMVFKVNKGFSSDDLTRTVSKPEPQRIILPDGLLVDATLTDVGNVAATRATSPTYEDIPDNSKGIALICAAGDNTIKKVDEFTVSSGKLSISMPSPNTGSYDIYFYLNEAEGITTSTANLTGATVGSDVTKVEFTSRPASSKDDYAKVSSVAASATTMANEGEKLIFTPLNAELMLEVQAGITPLSGFATTLSGIQASSMEHVFLSSGNFTGSGTSTTTLNNQCYTVDGDRQYPTDKTKRAVEWKLTDAEYANYSGSLYGDTLWSSGGYQRFTQLDPASSKQATLHITSISGPDGTETGVNVAKTYNIDMLFKSTTYQNGHRYKLILQLATPINGYEGVDQSSYVGTGTVLDDTQGQADPTDNVANFTASATWPALCGRPQYYMWDAKKPILGTGKVPTTTNLTGGGSDPVRVWHVLSNISSDPSNPTAVASQSCAKCPTYNQICWYIGAGYYWDGGRWYCPNGFPAYYRTGDNNGVHENEANYYDIVVHKGGGWLKKLSAIGADAVAGTSTFPRDEQHLKWLTSARNIYCCSSVKVAKGKPGVVRLQPADANHQNPYQWFFLPAAGVNYTLEDDGGGNIRLKKVGTDGYYYSSIPYDDTDTYFLGLSEDRARVGWTTVMDWIQCLWNAQ